MNLQLKSYIPLIDFLAVVLGKDTEIVLQDFTDGLDHSVVYIKNNLSGRDAGAPATDFVLDVFKSKIYKEKDYLVNYRTKTIAGKELFSSSYFIKDEDKKLLGMICINSDKSKLLALRQLFVASIESLDQALMIDSPSTESQTEPIIENFYSTAENLIEASIIQETQGKDLNKYNLTRLEKISIVRSLYQKGFFDLKDAVSKVAEAFRMSEVSIYKYIQTVKQED
ncbi:helix-turn-helix transcriptional regulator [Streptococcus sp. S784/96/1]|uniref:helix-turn-helix transcriptional regulator n=1 Tax=Streptococcus sp. S784/96/1 TaxID=2653499 RepID=UPI0013899851|nr:PAS domain-containing protein [Streptococcus sp. S784/96/1]